MANSLAKRVGENVRALRRIQGLTQEQLGRKAGWDDHRMVGFAERGNREMRLSTAETLARALGVPAYVLFLTRPETGPTDEDLHDVFRSLPADLRQMILEMLGAAMRNGVHKGRCLRTRRG